MPANIISINGSDDLSWQVGDSKMVRLFKWLNKNGFREVKKGKAKFMKGR